MKSQASISYKNWVQRLIVIPSRSFFKRKTGEDGNDASKETVNEATVEAAPKVPAVSKTEPVPVPTHSGPVK